MPRNPYRQRTFTEFPLPHDPCPIAHVQSLKYPKMPATAFLPLLPGQIIEGRPATLGVLGGGQPAASKQLDASGILGRIFGSQQAQAQNQIGQASGLSSGQAGQLLQMLAPIVMGFLAKQVGSAKLDAGGLGNLLGGLLGPGGQSQPQSGGLAGGLLSSALDQNGDGKLDAGDLLKLGSRLLGGKS